MDNTISAKLDASGLRFAIVVSRFNEFITSRLLAGARDALMRHGAAEKDLQEVWVPGSWEMPLTAGALVGSGRYDAVICLGCVIRGDTSHHLYVANEATKGLAQVSLETGVPIGFGLLTTDTIEQGVGYWIKVLGGDPVIDVLGEPTDDSTDFEVSLVDDTDPGRWNLVGHPFTSDVAWADVKVVDSSTSNEYLISDATAGNYITNRTAYTWNGSSYQSLHPVSNPGSFSTFDGFWVRAKAGSSLLIPPAAAKKKTIPAKKRDTADGWWIQLTASSGDYSDPGNRLGRMTVSHDGSDEYDLEEMAPFSSPYLTLVFPHQEWNSDYWSHTTDFRELRPGAGGSWDFEIRSDVPRDVVLSWHGEGDVLPDLLVRSVLVDVENSQTIDPQPGGSYVFTTAADSHRLRWQVNSLPQLDAGSDQVTYSGVQVFLSASFSDEDPGDTHTATIDWDDGAVDDVVADPAGTVEGSHTFFVTGAFQVEVCVTDAAGASTCDTVVVQVSENTTVIFSDGFETGDTSAWSQ